MTRRDELGELRRVAALARGYLREQVEGTRVEEHAYRARLAAALALVEPEDELRLTDPPTELRRCVAELVAQVAELEAVAELRELRDQVRDEEHDEAEAAAVERAELAELVEIVDLDDEHRLRVFCWICSAEAGKPCADLHGQELATPHPARGER